MKAKTERPDLGKTRLLFMHLRFQENRFDTVCKLNALRIEVFAKIWTDSFS